MIELFKTNNFSSTEELTHTCVFSIDTSMVGVGTGFTQDSTGWTWKSNDITPDGLSIYTYFNKPNNLWLNSVIVKLQDIYPDTSIKCLSIETQFTNNDNGPIGTPDAINILKLLESAKFEFMFTSKTKFKFLSLSEIDSSINSIKHSTCNSFNLTKGLPVAVNNQDPVNIFYNISYFKDYTSVTLDDVYKLQTTLKITV